MQREIRNPCGDVKNAGNKGEKTMKITFEIPGNPVGKARPRVCVKSGYAHAYTPKKTEEYERLVRLSFLLQTDKLSIESIWDKPLRMRIYAYYSVPKGFTKKNKNEALNGILRPKTKPDWDNVGKIVCDALNKTAYKDDSQIVEAEVKKFYSTNPKILVEIEVI